MSDFKGTYISQSQKYIEENRDLVPPFYEKLTNKVKYIDAICEVCGGERNQVYKVLQFFKGNITVKGNGSIHVAECFIALAKANITDYSKVANYLKPVECAA